MSSNTKITNTKPSSQPSKDSENIAGLTPDEFADKILGVVKEHENDEKIDLEACKFWFEAAYKDELSDLFKEKNRRRALIDALLKHGYDEQEINGIFIAVEKEKRARIRYSEEARERSVQIQQKIMRVLVFLFSVFVVTQLFIKNRQFEQARIDHQIYDAKVVKIEMANTPLYKKGPLETSWSIIPLREPIAREGYSLRAEAESRKHKLILAENAELTMNGVSDLEIKNLVLNADNDKIVGITIHLVKGQFSWAVAENSGIDLRLEFAGGNMVVLYGEGKAEMNNQPWRIAIKDGENRLNTGQIMSRAFNGMMEVIFEDPVIIRMFDHY